MNKWIILVLINWLMLFSCQKNKVFQSDYTQKIQAPDFNADSAFYYIEKQLSFGPRVPKTPAHQKFGDHLVAFLQQHATQVHQQHGQMMAFDSTAMPIRNIIACFNTKNSDRIMIYAHWDTRYIADLCADTSKITQPIPGANDGGSGVAVLMELARLMAITKPNIGVDLVFFDAEDQGEPIYKALNRPDSWCLGAQYWALNKPDFTGKPRYGVLLDMVGAKNARFVRESGSEHYLPELYDLIWKLAHEKGFGNYFAHIKGRPIIDDHLYVSQLGKVKSVAIIHNDDQSKYTFGHYWHTHNDNIDIIDKQTLKAVGQTMTELIYYY